MKKRKIAPARGGAKQAQASPPETVGAEPRSGGATLMIALVVAVIVFLLDQGSKYWVLEGLGLRQALEIEVLPVLRFVLAYNTGVNFGLFASGSSIQIWGLALFAVIVSIALFIWSRRTTDRRLAVACGLVAGGALANALDRLLEGAVIDFINVDCCGIGNPYAFNLADCAIFLGAIAIAVFAWRDPADSDGDEDDKTAKAST